jgi:hypothetical protein
MRTPTQRTVAALLAPALTAIGLTLSATSSAHAAAYPSCSGKNYYTASTYSGTSFVHEYGWYWSKSNEVCIGQADLAENWYVRPGLDERVRVRAGGSSGALIYQGFSGGTQGGQGLVFTHHVNQLFPYGTVGVCVTLVHASDKSVVTGVPTICKNLG